MANNYKKYRELINKDSVTQKFLDYKYIKNCCDAQELEAIINTLTAKTGSESISTLIELAENRLAVLDAMNIEKKNQTLKKRTKREQFWNGLNEDIEKLKKRNNNCDYTADYSCPTQKKTDDNNNPQYKYYYPTIDLEDNPSMDTDTSVGLYSYDYTKNATDEEDLESMSCSMAYNHAVSKIQEQNKALASMKKQHRMNKTTEELLLMQNCECKNQRVNKKYNKWIE